MFFQKWFRIFTRISALLLTTAPLEAARLEVHNIPGVILRGNPLGDPPARRLAVFAPDGVNASRQLPLVLFLPAWGVSSEEAIEEGSGGMYGQVVDQLALRGLPVRLAVVDARSRYGGSQYLNSSATGDYADYLSKEILPELQTRYPATSTGPKSPVIAGHSSGGYGALLLAISRKGAFSAVVALSPDSDFETTHKPLVQTRVIRRVTQEELDSAMAESGKARLPRSGQAQLMMGLSANYAPVPGNPGHFEWLYSERGEWRPEIWQRWLELDPLTIIRRRIDAFGPEQRIYLDGAEHDEFGANIGARKIYEVLRGRKSPVAFYESPGLHGDHLTERLVRGLTWAFGKQNDF